MPSDADDAYREQVQLDFQTCELPRKGLLDPLYWGVKENPGNLDSDSARLACYQRFDLVGDDVTVDQFMADPDNQIYARTDGDAWGCDKDPFNYQGGHPDVDSDDLSESDLAASHSVDG